MRVPLSIPPSAVFILVMLFPLSFAVLGEFESGKPILIVRQSPVAPQKLEIVPNGVDFLRSVNLPITPVVVIGPYRSGKSFLLNQLLGTECSKGFGVGHQRHAETKGIWMWSVPQIYQSRAIMYIDTEGFESAGKAAVYDDRIFAVSALIASLLIYNLPETIRETDIAKLSFAVELAQEFGGNRQAKLFKMPHLLWLIQRDFLKGQSVLSMVNTALQSVPNSNNDASVNKLNYIRASLRNVKTNFSAFGLPQPHLSRTKLCDLKDRDFDPIYIQQREKLRSLVKALATPKTVGGLHLNGEAMAAHIGRMIIAVNAGNIPTVDSITDTFNRKVLDGCLRTFSARMTQMKMPVNNKIAAGYYRVQKKEAFFCYHQKAFGKSEKIHLKLLNFLEEKCSELHRYLSQENTLKSSELCEKIFFQCQEEVEKTVSMKLPSISRFSAYATKCNASYKDSCIGPAKGKYQSLLNKMYSKELKHFLRDYNSRLMNGMTFIGFGTILFGRFVINSPLIEVIGWAAFAALEFYPKLVFLGSKSVYEQAWWMKLSKVWEMLAFNKFYDLNNILTQVYCFFIFVILMRKIAWFRSCVLFLLKRMFAICPTCSLPFANFTGKTSKSKKHIV